MPYPRLSGSTTPTWRSRRVLRSLLVVGIASLGAASFVANAAPVQDLTELSLDELGALSISAAAKHSQPLFETPAAVSAFQANDLLRMGDDSVADALRLIPGVHVAQLNAYRWQIGVRGFNGLMSTKLLVMVDGRNLYSPYYGSVDWAEADVPIEDLAQVEVVRGPGATLWGVNAVNGIVSITTKSASDTQGSLLSVRDGTGQGLSVYARNGGTLGQNVWYRVYVRSTDTEHSLLDQTTPGEVPFKQQRVGLRIDDQRSEALTFTWQAEFLNQENHPVLVDPASGHTLDVRNVHRVGSLLGRMTRRADDGELTVQIYADRTRDKARGFPNLSGGILALAESGDNIDLDISDVLKLGDRNELVWGGGLRGTHFDTATGTGVSVQHPIGTDWRYNLFAQDELTLVPDQLKVTLGTKIEHHGTVGFQLLPSARIAYTPDSRHTWWAAVSRAVRAPSRAERDIFLPVAHIPATPYAPPMEVNIVTTPNTREEIVTAYEIGWRYRPQPQLILDATAYVNDYAQLRNLSRVTTFQAMPPLVTTNLTAVNDLRAVGYGIEADATWRVSDRWTLAAGVANERLQPKSPPVTAFVDLDFAEPTLTWNARSALTLPHDFELSAALYKVSGLSRTTTPGYARLDLQLTLRPRPELELNVGVQNALDPRHPEFTRIATYSVTEVPRNIFGRVQWRF